MKVLLRVLTALNAKDAPNPGDVEAQRGFLGRHGPANLDELACEVIQKALHRVKVRDAMKASGVS